jgi:hypothetical protein
MANGYSCKNKANIISNHGVGILKAAVGGEGIALLCFQNGALKRN